MVKEEDLSTIIVLGMLFLIALGISFINLTRKNRKIKQLADALLQEEIEKKELEKVGVAIMTQENERTEIARRLHDEVGALLSIVRKNLSSLEDSYKKGSVNKEYFFTAVELLDEGTYNLRNLFKELMPHYLIRFGLAESLNRMGTQKTKHFIDEFEFINELLDEVELTDELMMHFFYIASELITNLIKHSHPNAITLKISMQDENLILSIHHDGIALTQDDYLRLSQNTENLGLENIRYRLDIIQAKLLFSRENKLGVIRLLKQIENIQ
jgi:two-component system NarL family sensor kinase